jgi:hypothetical protein
MTVLLCTADVVPLLWLKFFSTEYSHRPELGTPNAGSQAYTQTLAYPICKALANGMGPSESGIGWSHLYYPTPSQEYSRAKAIHQRTQL